jgi:hypothetical protein
MYFVLVKCLAPSYTFFPVFGSPSVRSSRRDLHRPDDGGVFHREGFHRNEAFRTDDNDEFKDNIGGGGGGRGFQPANHVGFQRRVPEGETGGVGGFLRESVRGGLSGRFPPQLLPNLRHRSESPRLRRAISPPAANLARGPSHLYGHPLFRASHGDLTGHHHNHHHQHLGPQHFFSSQRDLRGEQQQQQRFRWGRVSALIGCFRRCLHFDWFRSYNMFSQALD